MKKGLVVQPVLQLHFVVSLGKASLKVIKMQIFIGRSVRTINCNKQQFIRNLLDSFTLFNSRKFNVATGVS
jgi:hypothetical protein